MWDIERFEPALTSPNRRKRLNLDACDRVLDARSRPASGMALRDLVGETGWSRLAHGIRFRLGTEPARGERRIYTGRMLKVALSWAGRIMAHAGRLLGTPMAWSTGLNIPCDVHVYREREDGLVWERRYDFGDGRPQIARTIKRCDGSGRLLECFGKHAGMTLRVFEEGGALHFVSEDFFLLIGRWKLKLPGLFSPGELHVAQHDKGGDLFRFTLEVNHPLFGRVAEQDGLFREMEA
ncbi:MAG: DUF4166 domain-containing protein [Pseudomonadota bacterium]